jgi:hypothetical protein
MGSKKRMNISKLHRIYSSELSIGENGRKIWAENRQNRPLADIGGGIVGVFPVATDDLRASLALAFFVHARSRDGHAAGRIFRQKRREKKRRHRLAREEVRAWTFLSDEEAQAQVERLFPAACVLLRLPEVIAARSEGRTAPYGSAQDDVTVATTGKISDGARMFAASVTNRRIRLLDEGALAEALAKSAAELHEKQTKVYKKRLLSVLYAKSVNRKNAPRQAMYGALLMNPVSDRRRQTVSAGGADAAVAGGAWIQASSSSLISNFRGPGGRSRTSRRSPERARRVRVRKQAAASFHVEGRAFSARKP